MFRFTEPSSAQFTKHSTGTFAKFLILIINICCVMANKLLYYLNTLKLLAFILFVP
jgi:hypothetical protein